MKKKISFLLLAFIVEFSFLFSPPPEQKGPNAFCPIQYVAFNKYMGIPINCDEFTFIGAAIDPSYLFQQNYQRQSRPGYILLGTIAGYSLYYISYPLHPLVEKAITKKFTTSFPGSHPGKEKWYPYFFAGFIVINFLSLWLSFILFDRIIEQISGKWKNSQLLFMALLIPVASNVVSKYYFWVAHQQIFNILTPLLCIYTALILIKNKNSSKKIFFIALLEGFLLLIYGNFILLLPVIVWFYFHENKMPTAKLIVWLKMSLVIVCFFVPLFCWVILLKAIGINFYSYEFSQFRQFIWVIDQLKISFSSFTHAFYFNTLDFLASMGSLITILLLLLLTFLANRISISKESSVVLRFIFAECILFFWLLGYYSDRLTFSIAPVCLVMLALSINRSEMKKTFQYALIAIIILLHLNTVFFTPLHFSEKLFYQ